MISNKMPLEALYLTEKDIRRLETFELAGTPGLSTTSDKQKEEMKFLYFSGLSPSQIAQRFRVKKEIVLYFAKKFDWYEEKQEYAKETQERMNERIRMAELTAIDTLMYTLHFLCRNIKNQINDSYRTGEFSTSLVFLKQFDRFLRAYEVFNKLQREMAAVQSTSADSGFSTETRLKVVT